MTSYRKTKNVHQKINKMLRKTNYVGSALKMCPVQKIFISFGLIIITFACTETTFKCTHVYMK